MFESKVGAVPFKPKSLTGGNTTAQLGINLIEKVVLKMGSRWHPTVALDMGIDGTIELFDPSTGEPLNLVLHVQSKASERPFDRETADSFQFRCEERDLTYWLRGNARVIFIASRPSTEEVYWTDLRTVFADPVRRASRVITFDKAKDAFTPEAFQRLYELARPADSGIYLAPLRKEERLLSNLLPVTSVATTLYAAVSPYGTRDEVRELLHQKDWEGGGEYLVKGKRIYSFHDLREHPWTEVCDRGTVEDFATREWADAPDPDRRRDFVYLLNRALTEKLQPEVRWWHELGCYAFAAPPDLAAANAAGRTGRKRYWKARYQSHARSSSLAYFSAHVRKGTDEPSHFRHLGFEGRFRRYAGTWYLEITPTYVFTYDGFRVSRFHDSYLKGIKRIERNRSVVAQLVLWAEHLRQNGTLFDPPYPHLTFGDLLDFEAGVGLDDNDWMCQEDPDEAAVLADEEAQLTMFDRSAEADDA